MCVSLCDVVRCTYHGPVLMHAPYHGEGQTLHTRVQTSGLHTTTQHKETHKITQDKEAHNRVQTSAQRTTQHHTTRKHTTQTDPADETDYTTSGGCIKDDIPNGAHVVELSLSLSLDLMVCVLCVCCVPA